MKNYTVKYVRGHLIDEKHNNRIILKRGGVFSIQGDDHLFEEKDELINDIKPLDSVAKKAKLDKYYDPSRFHLEQVAEAGTKLYFRVGLYNRASEDKTTEYVFDAYLLEDLYMRTRNGEKWSLCECYCESRDCPYGELQMIESVRGYSLSNLFSNIVAFYFPLQRSGATNALRTFHFASDIDNNAKDSKEMLLHILKYSGHRFSLQAKRENLISKKKLKNIRDIDAK